MAVDKNINEFGIAVQHICIEPFEQPWLESMQGITVLRDRVEELDWDWSTELSAGDLLFVDSSHIIRPQGDVLIEYLQIFPKLSSGVYVHVHDIFTPKDYLESWIIDDVRFWNEQYLLEALLSNTSRYEVVAALNRPLKKCTPKPPRPLLHRFRAAAERTSRPLQSLSRPVSCQCAHYGRTSALNHA